MTAENPNTALTQLAAVLADFGQTEPAASLLRAAQRLGPLDDDGARLAARLAARTTTNITTRRSDRRHSAMPRAQVRSNAAREQ
jgi:hypothetical protein